MPRDASAAHTDEPHRAGGPALILVRAPARTCESHSHKEKSRGRWARADHGANHHGYQLRYFDDTAIRRLVNTAISRLVKQLAILDRDLASILEGGDLSSPVGRWRCS
jgi:hypothetical protein